LGFLEGGTPPLWNNLDLFLLDFVLDAQAEE
jgi:hypothetical protein